MPNLNNLPGPKKATIKRTRNGIKTRRAPGVDKAPEKKPHGMSRDEKRRKRDAVRAKQLQALELRMGGATYKDIAGAMGYSSPSAAKKAVDSAISRTEMDAAKEVVILDLSRLDEFQMRCMHALRQNGDLNQIDRLMRIMEMRYRLLGITDETVRQLQSDHGIASTTVNNNNVQVVVAAPETEDEFIRKMMGATGVNPDSPEAKKYLKDMSKKSEGRKLPLLEGSANDTKNAARNSKELEESEIIDAEIVEDMDSDR